MTTYLKRLWNWIWEGKYLFLFILIVLIIFQLDKLNIGYETIDIIRVFGLGLQLLGTLTILISLKDKLQLFNGHGLFKFIWNFILRFPLKINPRKYNLKADSTSHAMTTGTARIVIKPKEDFKDMLEYIDEEVKYIHQRLSDLKRDLKKETGDLKIKIDSIKMILGTEIKGTKELIKNSAVSNIWLEIFGIACIFIGLILGTVPDIVEFIV